MSAAVTPNRSDFKSSRARQRDDIARHVGYRERNERLVAGNGDRMSAVLIGGGFDNAAQSGNSTARDFCKSRARLLLRSATTASRFAAACETAAMIASPSWLAR
jgi:hypothetical protein